MTIPSMIINSTLRRNYTKHSVEIPLWMENCKWKIFFSFRLNWAILFFRQFSRPPQIERLYLVDLLFKLTAHRQPPQHTQKLNNEKTLLNVCRETVPHILTLKKKRRKKKNNHGKYTSNIAFPFIVNDAAQLTTHTEREREHQDRAWTCSPRQSWSAWEHRRAAPTKQSHIHIYTHVYTAWVQSSECQKSPLVIYVEMRQELSSIYTYILAQFYAKRLRCNTL